VDVNGFWARVDKGGECWTWTKGCTKGYGTFRENGRLVYAHRRSFELATGETLTPDVEVLHSCDNPPCVRPDHLRRGTQADNMRDMSERGRVRNQNTDKTHCIHGHELTEDNIVKRKKNARECRTCHQRNWREWDARRQGKADYITVYQRKSAATDPTT
jgi:hypothetical protein